VVNSVKHQGFVSQPVLNNNAIVVHFLQRGIGAFNLLP
mgnify:CR=1